MPPEETTATEPVTKPAPPSEVDPAALTIEAKGANIEDVHSEFYDIEANEDKPKPPPKREAAREVPPPKPAAATSAESRSGKAGEDTSKKPKDDTSASSAGSDEGKDKSFKAVTDAEYARMDKPQRVAYNASLRQQNSRLEQDLRTVRSELQQVKSKGPDNGRLKETQELLDATRAELKQAQEHIRLTAYERSQEFEDKYRKPFLSAYTLGRNKTAGLKTVQRTNADTGEVTQSTRAGTQEDFDAIMRIGDDDAAAEYAEQLFGPKAPMVLYYRERVNELQKTSQDAIQAHREAGDKLAKEQSEAAKRKADEQESETKARTQALRSAIDQGVEKHADWFEVPEGDKEAASIVEAGKAVAESIFSGVNPKTGQPYTKDGMIRFHAFIRNAVAAHGPLLHKLDAANRRIGELEAELSEFKESSTLEDAGRKGEGERDSEGRLNLPGREEFEEADRRR